LRAALWKSKGNGAKAVPCERIYKEAGTRAGFLSARAPFPYRNSRYMSAGMETTDRSVVKNTPDEASSPSPPYS
jgi:hypothetical protein